MPVAVDIRSILHSAVVRKSDRIALHFEGKAYTYQHLNKMSDALAASWLEKGCRQQRIALLLPNSVELIYCYLAALKAGVVIVPLNFRLKAPEIAAILDDAQPKQIIVHEDFLEEFAKVEFNAIDIYHKGCEMILAIKVSHLYWN